MRILIVIDCYLPSAKSSAQMADDLAREFMRQSHEVTILAPSDAIASCVQVERSQAFQVIRFKTGRIKGAPLWLRGINEVMLSFYAGWRTRRVLRGQAFDTIVFYSPSIFFGPLVKYFKRRWGVKAYLVLRDIFPDWAVAVGVMKKGIVYRLFKIFEKIQYAAADVIGVETSQSSKYFERTAHSGKVELLRNWATSESPPTYKSNYRQRLGLVGKTVFVYGGNIGVAQDMDNIIRLSRKMAERPDVHFLLVGEGSEVARLKALIAEEGIRNVTILPPVDQDNYLALLSECDVGLISLDRNLKTFSNSGKLLGYLRSGLPVLASYNEHNDLGQLLHDSGAGLGSVNGEDEAFYLNAQKMCDPDLRGTMGRNSRRLLAEVFSVEHAAFQILDALVRQAKPDRSCNLKGGYPVNCSLDR